MHYITHVWERRLVRAFNHHLQTQEAGVRIIDKVGAVDTPADRDHCLQYMVAIPLILGRLTTDDYEDEVAAVPRIDSLRNAMEVTENTQFSRDYLDPDKRAIANAIQIFFKDGSATERVEVAYPIGHPRRRADGIPLLRQKFEKKYCNSLIATAMRANCHALRRSRCARIDTHKRIHGHVGCKCLNASLTRQDFCVCYLRTSKQRYVCSILINGSDTIIVGAAS